MTLQLTVPNIVCLACSDPITQAIQAVGANARVQANDQAADKSFCIFL